MRVCVVAEFYPRATDPVIGIWAHRQAVAARDAGADVRVVALHRPVPPAATPRERRVAELRRLLAQPTREQRDGLDVRFVRFASPPRPGSYGTWGAWAAPPLGLALRRLHHEWPFELLHAHNAVPSGDALRRGGLRVPTVISVHGGDVFHTALQKPDWERAVRRTLGAADLVIANSAGIEAQTRALGATATRVVHLGTDVPERASPTTRTPLIATVAHLVARKRHGDVLRALWLLRDSHPELRYLIVGDGPERRGLQRLAAELGLAERVQFTGQLEHAEALRRSRAAQLFVLPSVDEAFGVAYVEAMAAGIPVIASVGEPGPQEIATAGDGIRLVPPADPEVLARAIAAELADPRERLERGRLARETVLRSFTWERCGTQTLAAYRHVLAGRPAAAPSPTPPGWRRRLARIRG